MDANDSNEYADLSIALKGGQNNLGVVTRFDLRTFRHGLYWGGNLAYPDSTEEASCTRLRPTEVLLGAA
jgi:hypothetical protein